MPFGRRSPFEALALPGAILAYKYSQFRQRRREAASRRVTERELSALHYKIDKLLNKLEESEPEPPTSQEDECVICINARATMQTSPCGHRVVCRRCFVKTIQSAVAQRLLPLRCVICRARITRLTSSSGTWRLQESASNYSMGTTNSWAGMGASASSYSVGDRVAQSSSLYSMSSGTSFVSANSNASHCSNTSGSSDGLSSNASVSTSLSARNGVGVVADHRQTQQHHQPQHHAGHPHSGSCSDGCSGAYPRNTHPPHLHPQYNSHHRRSKSCRITELNRLPPIKEFRSPTKVQAASTNPNQKTRFASYTTNSKNSDHSRLIEEETSLSIITHMSTLSLPVTTKSKSQCPSSTANSTSAASASSCTVAHSTTKHQLSSGGSSSSSAITITSKISGSSKHHGSSAKIVPISNLRTPILNMATATTKKGFLAASPLTVGEHIPLQVRNKATSVGHSTTGTAAKFTVTASGHVGSSSRGFTQLGRSSADEREDNRKNENAEKRKRDEKAKAKAEKDARKEEKRLAREEERLAKQLAKEEKKKGKREAKEMLLADGCRRK